MKTWVLALASCLYLLSPFLPASHLFTLFLTQAPCLPLLYFLCQFSLMFLSLDTNELLAQQPQRKSLNFASCRDTLLRDGWPHSFFKEMFIIFFLFKRKKKICSLWKKIEVFRKNIKGKAKVPIFSILSENDCF